MKKNKSRLLYQDRSEKEDGFFMITLLAAKKTRKEAQTAFLWRNDPETVRFSYAAREKSWDSFWMEYFECYFIIPDLCPHFVVFKGEKVGFMRFEQIDFHNYPPKSAVEVMINIAPDFRRQGIGLAALSELKKLMKNKGIKVLVADIRKENIASCHLFENAGFEIFSERKEFIEITREKCDILCYCYVLDHQ